MYIRIDPSEKSVIQMSAFDENQVAEERVEASNRELLASLDAFLKRIRTETSMRSEIEGVVVVVGAGGFTSTRLAVTIANTFGYVLGVPLLAITKKQAGSVQKLIPALLGQPKGQYISAMYSAEPSITKPAKQTYQTI
jgi:tRNA A37 threonylcarbamoyladenosine modification protein TsaB